MRVVLIGGNGFIGSSVANYLALKKYSVIVFDKIITTPLHPSIQKITGDFENPLEFKSAIQEGDCVIHLAATSVPVSSGKNNVGEIEHNLLPAIRLFEICAEQGVGKIIFASSGGSVYGTPQYIPIDENHPLVPSSVYGLNKLSIENFLVYFANRNNIKPVILRISNPFGPNQIPFRGQGVIATFLASVLLGKTISIWGDGSAVRDYIYIADLVKAFQSALEYQGEKRIFNIGSGNGHSINQIVQEIRDLTQIDPSIEYIGESDVEVHANILDITLAKNELQWEPVVSLRDGLKKTLDSWDYKTQRFIGGLQ